jgi:CheY-like chemotaxis protein
MIETFKLACLFEDLGFAKHKRVDTHDMKNAIPPLRADLQLLSCILFNAVHNALVHGEKDATVTVSACLEAPPDMPVAPSASAVAGEEADGDELRATEAGGSAGCSGGDSCSGSFKSGQDSRSDSFNSSSSSSYVQRGWEGRQLRVTVGNPAGVNHEALRALGVDDLLGEDSSISTTVLQHAQSLGSEQSTYLGLPEMLAAARMLPQPAQVHLWVGEDRVTFELTMPVEVQSTRHVLSTEQILSTAVEEATTNAPDTTEATGSAADASQQLLPADVAESTAGATVAAEAATLPEGLAFVCCDDDPIPRFFAESVLLSAAHADVEASLVIGETYDEVASVPDVVMRLAEERNHQVFCVFDQNLTNYHEGEIFGTSLCRELRNRGFHGAIVIQSANDEMAAEREYLAAGANGCLGKVIRGGPTELVGKLAAFWREASINSPLGVAAAAN